MASANCAVCDKPAPNKCGGCKTYSYCSKECQASDWPKHKAICKDTSLKQVLERATAIIHQASLQFRENTWDTPIDRIEDNADALVTYDGVAPQRPNYFVGFPHQLMPNHRAKKAVLTMLTCQEPFAHMYNMFSELTKGLPVKIEEIEVTLSKIPRKTTAVWPNGYRQDNWPNYSHSLLRVTSTKTKTSWIIDIGGGQYGICTPFWPWTDYVDNFINTSKPLEVYPHGTHRDVRRILGKIDGNPSMSYGLVGDVAEAIDRASDSFARNNNLQLSALIQLSDQEFQLQTTALLNAINTAVLAYKVNHARKIGAKWRASQRYERMNPGVSGVRNAESAKQLYAQRLVKTEYASGATSA